MVSLPSFRSLNISEWSQHETLVIDGSIRRSQRNLYDGYWKTDAWRLNVLFVGFHAIQVLRFGWCMTLIVTHDWEYPFLAAVGGSVFVPLFVIWLYQRVVRGFTSRRKIPLAAIESITPVRGNVIHERANEFLREAGLPLD